MNSEKLGLTLFDILGFLLPGYVLIFCISLIEATFLNSGYLSMQNISNNWFFFTILAYFGGHICHIIASLIKGRYFQHLGNKKYKLNEKIMEKVTAALVEEYNFNSKDVISMNSLDKYLLADSYIVSHGGGEERLSLFVREGFHKSVTTAFAVLFLTFLSSNFAGGVKLKLDSNTINSFDLLTSNGFAVFSLVLFGLFANRFVFYNRMKINNTYLLFLAYRGKEK
jgi:hypothetical protein